MANLKYTPTKHDHSAFMSRARERMDFEQAYQSLAPEYEIVSQLLAARTRAGLTQDAVAEKMGTTKSAVSRLEGSGKHAPSLATLRKYAQAVGCELQVRLVPQK
jgi:DNA-binding XRE family transcriptional regulator